VERRLQQAETSTAAAPIVVKTAVWRGADPHGRLDTFARGCSSCRAALRRRHAGRRHCDTPFLGSDKDVQLVTESGFDYATL
jgi:hypothetical protein